MLSKNNNLMKYSVVMAIYKNDRPEWLLQAINSLLSQTIKSNDIIFVRDGHISKKLEKILISFEELHKEITVIRLDRNVGAGLARNEGVSRAKNELVAIMDADDISLSSRFELQLAEFNSNAETILVGGQISEFEKTPDNVVGYRKVPTEFNAIKKFARYRSPINHVTIMFKKSIFLSIGGYPKMSRAEDYYMISALLANGYIITNLNSTIVNCRINSDNIRRRKSWLNVRENIISRWKIYRLGAISFLNFLISSMAQLILFVMPVTLLRIFFIGVMRTRHG